MESRVIFPCLYCDPIGIAINRSFSPWMQASICIISPQWDATVKNWSPGLIIKTESRWISNHFIVMPIWFFDYVLSMLGWNVCLSGWLLWYPFFKREDILCRLCMVLYALLSSLGKIGKMWDNKGENHRCDCKISAGAVFKLSSTICTQNQMQ